MVIGIKSLQCIFLSGLFVSLSFAETSQNNDAVLLLSYRQALRKDSASAEAAAKALVRFGPKAEGAVPELIAALRYDEPATADSVTQALAAIGPLAISPLMKNLSDSNFLVRARTVNALAGFGAQASRAAPAMADLLADSSFEVRDAAQKTLGQMGESGVLAVSAALRQTKNANRKIYLDALANMGEKAVPALVSVLVKDDAAFLRAAAASSIRQIGPAAASAVPALIRALSDLQEVVRAEAADALAAIGTEAKGALTALAHVSKNDSDALVRQKAAQAIQTIDADYQNSIPVLSAQLRDADPQKRLQAVEAMTESTKGSAAGLPFFRAALSDTSLDVKRAAIQALARLKESKIEAATDLTRMLSESNAALRQETIAALANLGPEGIPGLGLALKDPYSALADQAGKHLLKMGPEAKAELERLAVGFDPVLKKRSEDLLKRPHPKRAKLKK